MFDSPRSSRHSRCRTIAARIAACMAACIASLVIGGVALIAFAPGANAHAFLLFSDPAFDGALSDSPDTINLVFSEAVGASSATLTLSDSRGQQITLGPAVGAQGGTILSAAIDKDLASGIYEVGWDVSGDDGHGAAGEFRFAVGISPPLDGASSVSEPIDWGAAGRKGLLLAGFAISLGGLAGERLSTKVRRKNPSLSQIRSWAQLGAVVGLTSALASGAVLVGDAGQASELIAGAPGWRVIAEVLGFAAAWVLLRTGRGRQAIWPLLVVAVAEGFASHSDLALRGAGLVLTSIHLSAAGLWVGALLHVVRAGVAWRNDGVARELTLAYARLTAWLFGVVVITGFLMTALLVPISALTSTSYGRTLLLKVALVLFVAALAVIGRWALRRPAPRASRWAARTEVVGLGVVLGAAALLVSTTTPGSVVAAPPPPPTGTAVPAGGLAGQVGVNAVASEGQLVVRLSTPQAGNAYDPGEPTSYTLSGSADSNQDRSDLDFRPCGEGCFVATHTWSRGDNVVSLRADASGWRGGDLSSIIAWPATEADALVARTVRAMSRVPTLTVYETGTSEAGSSLPAPYRVSITGADYVDSEPFGAGVAPIAVSLPSRGGRTRVLLGFPASGIFVDLTLDDAGRITDEVLASPKHVFRRRFVYEP